MQTLIHLFQTPAFDWLPVYRLKKSARAKYLQIRVSQKHGLEIILPPRITFTNVAVFIQRKRLWIEKQAKLLSSPPAAETQIRLAQINLLAFNEKWKIEYRETTRQEKNKGLIEAPDYNLLLPAAADDEKIKQMLLKWLKQKAQAVFPLLLQKISHETGLSYKQLRIKNQQTLWGSCTVHKTINLSIALLFLPPPLVKYVLIHELCHTVHLNHSARFWQLVSQFDKFYKKHASETRKGRKYVPLFLQA